MENIDFLTYQEILEISDESERVKALEEFLRLVKEFERDCQEEFNYEKSVFDNYVEQGAFDDEKADDISTYLFPGDKVKYYPIITEQRAAKEYICAESGARINPGSYYVRYKALLYDETTKTAYVGTIMRLEVGYSFDIPMTLQEFENMIYRLEFSYDHDDDEYYNIYTNIRSYSLRKLKKK